MLILTVSRLYWKGKIIMFFLSCSKGGTNEKKISVTFSVRPQTSQFYLNDGVPLSYRKDDTSRGFKASYLQLTAALKPSYCLLFSLQADLHVWVSLYSSFFWHSGQLHHQELLMKKVTETAIVGLYLYQT